MSDFLNKDHEMSKSPIAILEDIPIKPDIAVYSKASWTQSRNAKTIKFLTGEGNLKVMLRVDQDQEAEDETSQEMPDSR